MLDGMQAVHSRAAVTAGLVIDDAPMSETNGIVASVGKRVTGYLHIALLTYVQVRHTWSLMMLQVSGTKALYSRAKAWLPVRGAAKV